MLDCSIVDQAMQLGARVVDLDTGELLASSREGSGPSSAGGLSTSHKPTVEKQAAVIGWPGASLVKVQHAGPYTLPQVGGGRRGKVKGFSRNSRRRLQRLIGTVIKETLPVFVTLTYPDQFPDDIEIWNIHLERLRARLTRKGWGCIWRREFKTRQSGENAGRVAPHYHLLVWGASQKEVRAYIPSAWYEVCGRICPEHLAAGTRVEVIRTWGGVAGYVSKYIAKVEDLPDLQSIETIGRFWGVINRDAIPWAEAITLTVEHSTVNTFFRYMRRYSKQRGRSSWPSLTIYVDDPWRWLELANYHELTTA